jgi:AraC-like DNA-binding protein
MEDYSLIINSCGITDCTPQWQWETPVCGFDDYDLWAVFRGHGELTVGHEHFLVEAGDCFILPPNHAIIGRHIENDPLLVMNVHFSISTDEPEIYELSLSKRYMTDQRFFQKLLERVISAHYKGNTEESVLWLNSALKEYFSFSDESAANGISRLHVQHINEICNEINERLAQASSLERFADKFGYSPSHLGRLFHKIVGISFSQYLTNARINQAKLMLRSSDITVNEISISLGYYDSGHFIKQFKRATGITPNTYRNLHSAITANK